MESGVALVTGSSSGIGAAIARRLAADGLRVVIHSRRSRDTGHELARELGGVYLQANLSDDEQAQMLVGRCVEECGRLDVLVNNAGLSRPIPHHDLAAASPEVWREILQVNLLAPWIVTTAAAEYLQASSHPGGGCIVNITSHAGIRPKGSSIPYAASKAALNHTTRLLARTLAPAVRANAIAPGLVDTPMTADWAEAQALWRQNSPMRRAAAPADAADIASAIVSSRYLTGEVIMLDGGLNLT
ncbi:MAG TPA: SDR family oxidoreductase [Mycobacteriales bacterium]|nr:SDR family oxidoreductase [Mycobacteriales bacterium]